MYQEGSGDNCSETYTQTQKNSLLAVAGCTGFISFCACVLAVTVVCSLKLHRVFTYRLAMYQVLSALFFSFTLVLMLSLINYNADSSPDEIFCKVQAFLNEYVFWVKLLFTISLVFHLFCLAVFLKNYRKLELFYVLFSILFPLLFSWIPFIHNNYGVAGAWCWIRDWKDDCATQHYLEGIIEQYTLWYGPLFVSLTFSVIATIIMLLVLLWRACRQQSINQPLLGTDLKNKHKETLKEVFPFLAYPVIFYCVTLFPLIQRISDVVAKSPPFKLALVGCITNPMIGLFSSLVLIIHVLVVKVYPRTTSDKNTRRTRGSVQVISTKRPTLKSHATTAADSSTKFVVPAESEVDKLFEYVYNFD